MRMPLAGICTEKFGDDRLLRQRRQRDRLYKLTRIGSHNHLHLCTGLDKLTQKHHTLVSRDSAADAKYYMFVFKHIIKK